MRLGVLGITVLLLLSPFVGVSVGELESGVASAPTMTVSGPAVPLPADLEQKYKENLQQVATSYGGSTRAEVFLMAVDGDVYIVTGETQPEPGEATVRGIVVSPSRTRGSDLGIIFANSVSISQSGPTLSLAEYDRTKDQYTGEVVEVTGHQRELAFLLENEGVVSKNRFGLVSADGGVLPLVPSPGQTARTSTIELSKNDSNYFADSIVRLGLGVNMSGGSAVPFGYQSETWWADAEATVTVLVLPDELSDYMLGIGSYVISADIEHTARVTPGEVYRRGSELEGQVVQVETQAIGTRISTKETLLTVARCAPESVTVPASPPLCVPLVADVVVHSGVAVTADSPDTVIPYAGLTNEEQDQAVVPERGTYHLTGRVVSTDRIDPRLPDGYGLLVFERQRVGDVRLTAQETTAVRQHATAVSERIRSQIEMSPTEFRNETRAQVRSTPTTTTTPAETPTSTPPTAAPTPNPRGDARLEIVNVETGLTTLDPGQTTFIEATVENTGDSAGTMTVTFRLGNSTQTRTISLEAEEKSTVTASFQPSTGRHRATVNGRKAGRVTVGQTTSSGSGPGMSVLTAVLAILLVVPWLGRCN